MLLRQLIDNNLLHTIADIYDLTQASLASLEHMGEKSAANVITAIEKSKSAPLDRVLNGLGVRMIGSQAAKLLAHRIGDIADLYSMSEEDLAGIEGIGPVMAQSIRLISTKRKIAMSLSGCAAVA